MSRLDCGMSRRTGKGKGKKWYYDLVTSVPADLGMFASFFPICLFFFVLSLGGLRLAGLGWLDGWQQQQVGRQDGAPRQAAAQQRTSHPHSAGPTRSYFTVPAPRADSRGFALFYFFTRLFFAFFDESWFLMMGFECVVNSERDFGLNFWFVRADFVGFVGAPSCLYDRHFLFLGSRFWGCCLVLECC